MPGQFGTLGLSAAHAYTRSDRIGKKPAGGKEKPNLVGTVFTTLCGFVGPDPLPLPQIDDA